MAYVTCPNCGTQILQADSSSSSSVEPPPVDAAEIERKTRQKAESQFGKEIELLKAKLKEKARQLEESRRAEADLKRKQDELSAGEQATTLSGVNRGPQFDPVAIEKEAGEKAEARFGKQIELLKVNLREKVEQLEEARRAEAELLSKQKALAEDMGGLQSKKKKREWEPAAADYLSGQEFKRRVESLLEALANVKRDLEGERLAMEKAWAKRGKQVQSALQNMAGLCGDLHGIMGPSFSKLKDLEISSGSEF